MVVLAGCLSEASTPSSPGKKTVSEARPLVENAAVRYAREHAAFSWVTSDTAHFRLYIEAGADAEARLATLGPQAEAAWRANHAYLGAAAPEALSARPALFFVNSRQRMGVIMGRPSGGMAVSPADLAFFVAPPDGHRPALRHELMHLLAWNAFGPRTDRAAWVDEGMATAAATEAGGCHIYTLAEVAVAVVREGRAVPLSVLAGQFRQFDDLAAYLQAASVVAFVRERYGMDAVAALWKQRLDAIEGVTGGDVRALDVAWRAHVAAPGHTRAVDWAAIREHGCE